MKDKLERANISDTEFKSVLNKIVSKIKTDKLISGNYNFIFTDFKIPVIFDQKSKEVFITTVLTKDMFVKKGDKKFIMECINIYLN